MGGSRMQRPPQQSKSTFAPLATNCLHPRQKAAKNSCPADVKIYKNRIVYYTRSTGPHSQGAVQLHIATGSANTPRLGVLVQTQRTALISAAAAAVGSHILRSRESEKVPAELRRDLVILASWVLGCVNYAHTAQLAVAAALVHQRRLRAAGIEDLSGKVSRNNEVTPNSAAHARTVLPLSREQRPKAEAALASTAAMQQGLAATLQKLQAAEQRLKGLQEGNMSLRTDITGEQIKLQAAAQVLVAKQEELLEMCSHLKDALDLSEDTQVMTQSGESYVIYEELLSNLQDSSAEAQAFVRVSHFIMDEALSKKESLSAHA